MLRPRRPAPAAEAVAPKKRLWGCSRSSGWLAADANRRRGEFVLVLHAREPLAGGAGQAQDTAHDAVLNTLMAELPLKQAVALAAELTHAPRNQLYARALALRQLEQDPPPGGD